MPESLFIMAEKEETKSNGDNGAPPAKRGPGRPRKSPPNDPPAPKPDAGSDVQRSKPKEAPKTDPPREAETKVAPPNGGKTKPEPPRHARTAKRAAPKHSARPDRGESEKPRDTDYTPYLILLGGALALGALYLARGADAAKKDSATENLADTADQAIAVGQAAWQEIQAQAKGINDKLQIILGSR